MDISKDLQIDVLALDKEWLRQSGLYLQYAEEAANAQMAKDRAEDQLDIVKGKIALEIRRSGAPQNKYGVEKITEGVIENLLEENEEYRLAVGNFLDAAERAKLADAASKAFDHKRKALEKLTDLWVTGYWAEPRVSNSAKDKAVTEKSEGIRRTLLSSRLRRRPGSE